MKKNPYGKILLGIMGFCLGLLSADIAGAQSEKQVWSLKICIETALENNLKIKRSEYSVRLALVSKTQAIGSFLPSMNASGAIGENYGRAINPVTNAYINRNSNTINIGASASLTLYNGFRIVNTFRQSQRNYEATDLNLQKAKNDLMLEICTLYVNVLINKELHNNARLQLNSGQEQLTRTQKMVEAGSMPLSNLYTQEATLASYELNLVNQENTLNLSLLKLKQAMQVPDAVQLDVEVPELTIEDLKITETPALIFEIAKLRMPEINSAKVKLEASQLALSVSRAGYQPRLSLGVNAQSNYSSVSNVPRTAVSGRELSTTAIGRAGNQDVYAYQSTYTVVSNEYGRIDQLKDNLFQNINLQLSIPIFNGLQSRTAVQQAKINREMAKIDILDSENQLRHSIETSYNEQLAVARSYAASLKQVKAREEAYRMDKKRYEAGALTPIELQISENNLFQSKSDLTVSKYNFLLKRKILDFYQGQEIKF